jgi:hypothetical protein
MTQMKPTVEEILKRKVQGHAPERVVWESAKKKASAQVDVSVFKRGLGPAIDSLRQVSKGALEVKRFYNTLDDRTMRPVKDQAAKVDSIVREYKKICSDSAKKAGLTPAQKQAWVQLGGAAEAAGAVTTNYVKPLKR